MGAKQGPGGCTDCSGLVSNVVEAGEEGNPNKGNKSSGVLNIQDNMEKGEDNDVVAGNIVTFKFSKGYPYHTGILKDVTKGENGVIIGFTMIHSSSGVGPNEKTVTIGEGKLGKGVYGYYKWDTKPDAARPPGAGGEIDLGSKLTNLGTTISTGQALREVNMYMRMAEGAKSHGQMNAYNYLRNIAVQIYNQKIKQ